MKIYIFLIVIIITGQLYCGDYIVKKDETLWSISRKFDIDIGIIEKLNELTNKIIYPEQKLFIPSKIIDYKVKKGDYILKIAKDHNISPKYIIILNNLPTEHLSENQIIKIPLPRTFSDNSPIINSDKDKKDNITSINNKNATILNTNINNLINSNNVYIVKKGDSLYSISKNLNVSLDNLRKFNNLTNDYIYENQRLIIYPVAKDTKKEIVKNANNINKINNINNANTIVENRNLNNKFPVNIKLLSGYNETSRGCVFFLEKPSYVYSINDGVVEYAGFMEIYNNVVIIKHKNNLRSIYGYLKEINVKSGDRINNGDIIGITGFNKNNYYLYFEVRKGIEIINIQKLFPDFKQKSFFARLD